MRNNLMLSTVLTLLLGATPIQAQAPAPTTIKRNELLKADMPKFGPMEGYSIEVEIAPGGESGWHYHPGHEFTYPLSGEATAIYDGKPSVILKPVMAHHFEPGVAHNVKNTSTTTPYKAIVVYIVEKGKPVSIPTSAK